MLNDLKREVCRANIELEKQGVVRFTWGNVSAFDPSMGLFVIKPSGVPYDRLQPEMMVVMSMDGQKVEGKLKPSSDAETHRAIYMAYPMTVGAIVHTHSVFATAFAQAGQPIPAYGTTHADHFYGDVPVTRLLTPEEIETDYEWQTGQLIAATIEDPEKINAVLVNQHGPFIWGKDARSAVANAVVLEEAAKMAYITRSLNPGVERMDQHLLDKHFLRKHGPEAYYGQ